jgi:hypothetical protein
LVEALFYKLILDEIIGFINLPNPSSRTMAQGSTQPLTEMGTWNLPGGKRAAGGNVQADNLTTIFEPMSRKRGILDVSQLHGFPRPVIGTT